MAYERVNTQLFGLPVTNYILVNNGGVIEGHVLVKSRLDSKQHRNLYLSLKDSGKITQFHYDKLIDHLHKGVVKTPYLIKDDGINNASLDINEFIAFIEGAVGIPFTDQNTIIEAIDILNFLGYSFERVIENNML